MVTHTPREVPPPVARSFYKAMRNYVAEVDLIKRDAIAAHQLDVMRHYQGSCEKPLRLSDIKRMFTLMNGRA